MRALRRRERAEDSRSRAAYARTGAPSGRRCSLLSAQRRSARLSAPAPRTPKATHAASPRCSRAPRAPLARPPEHRRPGGSQRPPRRDRSRGRRARCPGRDQRACELMQRPWSVRRPGPPGSPGMGCSRNRYAVGTAWPTHSGQAILVDMADDPLTTSGAHAAVGATLRWSKSASPAGVAIVVVRRSRARAQHSAAARSAAPASDSEASSWACRSCDGPALSPAPGQSDAARAYRREMLSSRAGGTKTCAAPSQPRLSAWRDCSMQSRAAGTIVAHARSLAPCRSRSAADSSVSESCASRIRGSFMTRSVLAQTWVIHGGEAASWLNQDPLAHAVLSAVCRGRGSLEPCAHA
jgi:hypothetical protein